MNMMHGKTAEPVRELFALGAGGRRVLICNQHSSKRKKMKEENGLSLQFKRRRITTQKRKPQPPAAGL